MGRERSAKGRIKQGGVPRTFEKTRFSMDKNHGMGVKGVRRFLIVVIKRPLKEEQSDGNVLRIK